MSIIKVILIDYNESKIMELKIIYIIIQCLQNIFSRDVFNEIENLEDKTFMMRLFDLLKIQEIQSMV